MNALRPDGADVTAKPPAWFARPRVVLPLLATLIGVGALLTPKSVTGRNGDERLTTYSSQPQGAKMFADFAQANGWTVERSRTDGYVLRPGIVQAILAPQERIAPAQVHAVLEHVRSGGGLLLIGGIGTSAFRDSLGLAGGVSGNSTQSASSGCASATDFRAQFRVDRLWASDKAYLSTVGLHDSSSIRITDTLYAVSRPRAPDSSRVVRITAKTGSRDSAADSARDSVAFPSRASRSAPIAVGGYEIAPAMIAGTLGRGRIVYAGDPDVLRNDALRVCEYGLDVAAARILAYLTPVSSGARTLRFDEYHHGFGPHNGAGEGVSGAMRQFLFDTTSGRAVAQLLVAALILLFALSPRGVAPTDPVRVERRSPFEHVDALARAYAQVGATRTATMRLVRGLRRRIERGRSRGGTVRDEQFLNLLVARYPAINADVERVKHALDERVKPEEFLHVGDAVVRIEHHILRR